MSPKRGKEIELRWPKDGVVDHQAHVDQPAGTTPLAKNVRTVVPGSNRSQGGKRPGYSDFTSQAIEDGERVQALAALVVDRPKVRYKGFKVGDMEKEWEAVTLSQYRALGVVVDDDGNSFVLDQTHGFTRYARDGTVKGSWSVPLPATQRMIPRIALDRDGNVYCGATDVEANVLSRIWKYTKVQDGDEERYVLEWTLPLEGGLREFRIASGLLYTLHRISYLDGSPDTSLVRAYDSLYLTDGPNFLFDRITPQPTGAMDIGEDGSIYLACPRNTKRGDPIEGGTWREPIVEDSVHSIADDSGSAISKRLHFWASATATGIRKTDGDQLTGWWDRRWLHTNTEASDVPEGYWYGGEDYGRGVFLSDESHSFAGPNDYGRLMYGRGNTDIVYGPIFRTNGFGQAPSLEFNPGHAYYNHGIGPLLGSLGGKSPYGDKEDTDGDGVPNDDGKNPCGSIIPMNKRACFAIGLLFRYVPGDQAQLVWAHYDSSTRNRYFLVVNADQGSVYPNRTNHGKRDSLTLYIDNVEESYSGVTGGTAQNRIASVDLSDSEYENDRNVVAVVINIAGTEAYNSANARNNSSLRVNGRLVDTWTMGREPGGTLAVQPDFIGGHQYMLFGAYFSDLSWEYFRGHVAEVVTVLGGSTTYANEWPPVSYPNTAWSLPNPGAQYQYTDMSAEDYDGAPRAYTSAASEVERLEGILVWANGCPDILKSGTPAVSGGYQAAHPFQDSHPTYNALNSGDIWPVGPLGIGPIVLGDAEQTVKSKKELLAKYSPGGELVWAIEGNGHGSSVKAGEDGAVFAYGMQSLDGTSEVVAKRLKDLGPVPRITGVDTWTHEQTYGPYFSPTHYAGCNVDLAGNFWIVWDAMPARIWIEQSGLPSDGDTIEISKLAGGSNTYTFKNTLASAYDVQIRSTAELTIWALALAIAGTGVPGTHYHEDTVKHPDVFPTWKYRELDGSVTARGVIELYSIWRNRGPNCNAVTVDLTGATNYDFEDGGGPSKNMAGGEPARVEVLGADDGVEQFTHEMPGPINSTNYGAKDEQATMVAFPTTAPEYNGDLDEGTPEFVWITQWNNRYHPDTPDSEDAGPTVIKWRLVHRTQVIGKDASPREVQYFAVCNGSLYQVSKDAAASQVTGGADLLLADSPWVRLVVYRSKLYGFDGINYVRYDPKTEEAETWKVDDTGQLPYGAKLGCVWNARIVLARTTDDPHNLYMSARGNPDDWDTDPAVVSPLAAFDGSASGNLHFRKPDLVTCLIPFRDDLLIVGGDTSIHRLTGDPGMQGQLDQITDEEGLAFGQCWTKDPAGNVYAMGTNGGIYKFGVDGAMSEMNVHNIEGRLQAVDQSLFDIVLRWSIRFRGMHVYVIPKNDIGGRLVEHYWYDAKEGAWWPDTFADTSVQPTATAVFDGDDPEDRHLVVGCEDGYIRFEDPDPASTKDGDYPIHSQAMIPVYAPPSFGHTPKFSHLFPVFDTSYGKCQVAVYAADTAERLYRSDPWKRWEVNPGREGFLMFKLKTPHLWVELNDATPGSRWALESMTIRATRAGEKKVR